MWPTIPIREGLEAVASGPVPLCAGCQPVGLIRNVEARLSIACRRGVRGESVYVEEHGLPDGLAGSHHSAARVQEAVSGLKEGLTVWQRQVSDRQSAELLLIQTVQIL